VTPSIDNSLGQAFDRFGDFVAVQGSKLSVEALDLMQSALGIDDETRRMLVRRLENDFQDDFKPAQVLLGVILGVSAAQLAEER
jgi:hypothetical protein